MLVRSQPGGHWKVGGDWGAALAWKASDPARGLRVQFSHLPLVRCMPMWGNGRPAWFRARFPQGSASSTLAIGTLNRRAPPPRGECPATCTVDGRGKTSAWLALSGLQEDDKSGLVHMGGKPWGGQPDSNSGATASPASTLSPRLTARENTDEAYKHELVRLQPPCFFPKELRAGLRGWARSLPRPRMFGS